MHVAQKCAAVLGQRHASNKRACRPKVRSGFGTTTCIKQKGMSPKSAQRFWDNDMHQTKGHVAQ
ncbi:hypothetical protein, partial [Mesorhizobium sp.]|uniref:hypothetical protein n=1 Tax=Mesorhizobium sp. TaxID=1871066 RepID=UPI00342D7371